MADSIRAALERLVNAVEVYDATGMDVLGDAIAAARAALAGATSPPHNAEGEVAELVKRLRDWHTIPTLEERTRAAELLQQQHPAPVPVSEGLPGDQLCWWYEPDEWLQGQGGWTLLRIWGGTGTYSHWLPATSLPLPQGEVQP